MTYPAAIFLGLLLWSFAWPKERLLLLMIGASAFGSLAVLPPALVGGINILPSAAAALVLIGRSFLDRREGADLIKSAFNPAGMGLLTAFLAVAVVSAVFFPRLFAGQVVVLSMRGALPSPLGPTMGNISQLAYLLISFGVAVIFGFKSGERRFMDAFRSAFLIGGALMIASGVADWVTAAAGLGGLLAPFKTAEYVFMENNQVLGFRRVTGFMTEASAYGSSCVFFAAVLLAFAPTYSTRSGRVAVHLLGLGLIGMAVVSTSSTAYVGLAVLTPLYILGVLRRIVRNPGVGGDLLRWEVLVGFVLVLSVATVALFAPQVFVQPLAFIETLIFKKTQTTSYADRSAWNAVAMEALARTGGVGVGVGSARTSSWAVAVLTNTGVLGASLLAAFILLQLSRSTERLPELSREINAGAKIVLIVNMVTASLAGTTPDFGGGMGMMFGLLVAHSRLQGLKRPDPVRLKRDAARATRAPSVPPRTGGRRPRRGGRAPSVG